MLGSLPGNVHVSRVIPQSLLLPRCSAVVSHGGSGTLLAALAHGLPQVCLPQAADQLRHHIGQRSFVRHAPLDPFGHEFRFDLG